MSANNEANLKPSSQDKKLGQILLDMKLVTPEQLAEAMADQQLMNAESKRVFKMGEVLVFKKIITMDQLHQALRAQTRKVDEHRNAITGVQKKMVEEKAAAQKRRMERKKEKEEPKGLSNFFSSFIRKK